MGERNPPADGERRTRLDELRDELAREHERIKALQAEIELELARHREPPAVPRRFRLIRGGLAGTAVAAGAEYVREHPVGLSLVTAVAALAFLLLPTDPRPESPHVALPPETMEPRPTEAQPDKTREPRRRFPPNAEVEPTATSAEPIEPAVTTSAPPLATTTAAPTRTAAPPPPGTPPTDAEPTTPRPDPQPSPRPCLRVVPQPLEVEADLEQCVDRIVGFLADAA